VESAATSTIYVDEAQRADGVRAAIERCADTFFDGRRRALWAARLLDTGLLFEETGRTHASRIAGATARMLAADAPVTAIPFATELFGRLFLRSQPAARPAVAAGSLVLPGDLREETAAQSGDEQVTPEGVIVPD
jgi:hypothetical protein